MNITDEMVEVLIKQLTRETTFPYFSETKEEKDYYVTSVMSMSEEKHIKEEARKIIKEWVKNNIVDVEISRLQAKCYAYEKIIANSNFKPILIEKVEE